MNEWNNLYTYSPRRCTVQEQTNARHHQESISEPKPHAPPDVQYPAMVVDRGNHMHCIITLMKTPGHRDQRIRHNFIIHEYTNYTGRLSSSMVDLPEKIGWVGLGIMGMPMVRNLLAKMKDDTQFYVYDVVQASIDQLVQDGQGRVHACSSSKDVADHSVRQLYRHLVALTTLTVPHTGHHHLHGARGKPRACRLPDRS